MREKISLNTIIVVLLAVVVVMGGALGYASYSHTPPTVPLPTPSEEVTDLLPESKGVASGSALIYYDQAGEIPLAERTQIQERFIEPLLEYHEWLATKDPVKTVSIRIGEQENGGQYIATLQYRSGKVEYSTIARDENGVMWWHPECATACVFSDAFASKYPEVVKSNVQ